EFISTSDPHDAVLFKTGTNVVIEGLQPVVGPTFPDPTGMPGLQGENVDIQQEAPATQRPAAIYRQTLYLNDFFALAFGGDAFKSIRNDGAAGEIALALAARDDVVSAARVLGGDGTDGNPWIVDFDSADPTLDDSLSPQSTDTNVNIGVRREVSTAYTRDLLLADPGAGITILLGEAEHTVGTAKALEKLLARLSQIATVKVTASDDTWTVDYTSSDFTTLADDWLTAADPSEVTVGSQTVVRTTYRQALYLDDTFEIMLGADGMPLTIRTANAAVSGASDAESRLLSAGLTLIPDEPPKDGEIAEQLIDPEGDSTDYAARKADRDLLVEYDIAKSVDLEYASSVLDMRIHMAKVFPARDLDLDFDLSDLPGLG
ncbi:MAG: hypothetical protein JRF63_10140, partial [Deltaproteobacteria bacterium]|nr:hypothetical protein [Deltaproteobacteria bacterium]